MNMISYPVFLNGTLLTRTDLTAPGTCFLSKYRDLLLPRSRERWGIAIQSSRGRSNSNPSPKSHLESVPIFVADLDFPYEFRPSEVEQHDVLSDPSSIPMSEKKKKKK